jgi:hypothetical protein
MPVNFVDTSKIPAYKPSKEDAELVSRVNDRITDLKNYRKNLKANPYDTSPKARTIENTWDFCDYVSLPHKYYHREMQDWMANVSKPMIYAKIDAAVALLAAKNPEVEIIARSDKFEKKTKILEALYSLSWDKGRGRQQLIKFIHSLAKYGFAVGREYHRYSVQTIQQIVQYNPDTLKHEHKEEERVIHDEPYFEVLPIRDCWFDHRAKPYDEDSMRDWCWRVVYDYSTFLQEFPTERYPNAKYVQPSTADSTIKADQTSIISKPEVCVYFYENVEDDEFIITDRKVLIYKGPLINHQLSCVWGMWRMRNEYTIYGIGLPEILEGNQELLDKIANMSVNQLVLAISSSGFYGGTGNVTEKDMILEPKLKKLRDPEKIRFVQVPPPSNITFQAIEFQKNEADEFSGITKSLVGEQIGKTLGEAILNREAGLQRLSLPLNNIEFALERHARLRIDNIQRIYSRPIRTEIVMDELGNIVNEKLWQEYLAERQKLGDTAQLRFKFPISDTGAIYRNIYRTERMAFEKTREGELQPSPVDKFLEITPDEIEGEYDVKIIAMSTLPLSKELQASRALETFNIVAKLPYTDLYQAEKTLLKARDEDPDDWMKPEEQIIQTQQLAEQARGVLQAEAPNIPPPNTTGGAETLVPPNQLEQPASSQGLSAQVSQALKL